MKIIEALKTIKANKEKAADLVQKIKANSAILSNQTSAYGDAAAATKQVNGWIDSVRQILRDNEILTHRIHKTNNTVELSITMSTGNVVTKTIDEWLTRLNGNIDVQYASYAALTDRGLKEEFITQPNGERVPITIVRHYNALKRDEALSALGAEKPLINSALEIVNATTDLLE